jgi:hypothetical protein
MLTLRNVVIVVAVIAVVTALAPKRLKNRMRSYFKKGPIMSGGNPHSPPHEEFYKPRPAVAIIVDPPLTNRNIHADRDDRNEHVDSSKPCHPTVKPFSRAQAGSGTRLTSRHPLLKAIKS